jgi:hypothetical protein
LASYIRFFGSGDVGHRPRRLTHQRRSHRFLAGSAWSDDDRRSCIGGIPVENRHYAPFWKEILREPGFVPRFPGHLLQVVAYPERRRAGIFTSGIFSDLPPPPLVFCRACGARPCVLPGFWYSASSDLDPAHQQPFLWLDSLAPDRPMRSRGYPDSVSLP